MIGFITRYLPSILTAILLTAPALAGPNLPDTIILSPKVLYQTKQRVLRRDLAVRPAYKKLIIEADRALDAPVESVTFKEKAGPSNDRQDYWSLSPDWWPNEETKSGLPYVQQAGKTNPEAITDIYDRSRLSRMAHQAMTLALAWYLTGNEQYASKGTALVWAWCGDSFTRANPNMLYARSRPGVANGHHSGIIETRDLVRVVDAAQILEPSRAWTKATSRKVKKWFSEYINWLMRNEFGLHEAQSRDHHGTWFDAQVAVYALYTGDMNLARSIVGTAERRRVARQIMPDGSMPYELEQPRSRNATFSTLEAYTVLSCLGEKLDLDLWNWADPIGPSIRQAFNFAGPYINPLKKWPHGATGAFDPYRYVPLFRRAALVYKDSRYLDYLNELPKTHLIQDRSILFY